VSDASSAERVQVASQYGLAKVGVRPSLGAYIRDVARHWAFARTLGTSTAYARNQNNYLGQMWAVLTPLLNAIVYILIFGILLDTNRGVENSIAFIVIGTFLFRFFEQCVKGGGQSIANRTNLIRSLQFPRAVLPLSNVLSYLATLLPALLVMCLMVLGSGLLPQYQAVPIRWTWLLLPVLVALLAVFNAGVAFMMARIVAITPDLDNLIAFFMRLMMYASGVIFPAVHYAEEVSGTAGVILTDVLEYQPVAVYLYVARSCLMHEPGFQQSLTMWGFAVGWAVLFFVGGFIMFWRGEERYGRD
jgi:teichoic acid transport system permease protein